MDVLNERVELALGVAFLLISLPGDSDSDFVGEISNALSPDVLVELGIDPDITSLHHLGHQLLNLLDCGGGFLLEGFTMSQFVNIDGRVNGSLVEAGSLFLLHHNSN